MQHRLTMTAVRKQQKGFMQVFKIKSILPFTAIPQRKLYICEQTVINSIWGLQVGTMRQMAK